ncbi:MAG: hypothetical protein PHI83_07465 [Sphaerochaetaceae bacterium]|jgi:hypothetical protein|nr:hypothetical protein [Sphaerochaetaceae bacterium]
MKKTFSLCLLLSIAIAGAFAAVIPVADLTAEKLEEELLLNYDTYVIDDNNLLILASNSDLYVTIEAEYYQIWLYAAYVAADGVTEDLALRICNAWNSEMAFARAYYYYDVCAFALDYDIYYTEEGIESGMLKRALEEFIGMNEIFWQYLAYEDALSL